MDPYTYGEFSRHPRRSPAGSSLHRGDVFYYRVQSPAVIAELDHHCGVFLD
jgi:hypothetical protein